MRDQRWLRADEWACEPIVPLCYQTAGPGRQPHKVPLRQRQLEVSCPRRSSDLDQTRPQGVEALTGATVSMGQRPEERITSA